MKPAPPDRKSQKNTFNVNILNDINLKEKTWREDPKFYIPTCIAIISLLLSLWIFWQSTHEAFEPTIYATGIYPFPNAIPISFVNNGAGAGVIEDAYISVKYDNETRNYSALHTIKPQQIYLQEEWNSMEYIDGPFQPIALAGKQSENKVIMFLSNPVKSGGGWLTPQDNVSIDIFVKTNDQKEYVRMHTMTVDYGCAYRNPVQEGVMFLLDGGGCNSIRWNTGSSTQTSQ
jgi:hypothetical protein